MRNNRAPYARLVQSTALEFVVLGLLAALVLCLSIPLLGIQKKHQYIASNFAALSD